MSLDRSSRFCFLGLARMKSELMLSSCASASSIVVHHGCMFSVSARERLLCLIPWVNPELFDLREDRSFQSFPFLFLSWLAGVLRARRQDKDGVQINVHLKCNLDREDCTSLRFPFILPYAWISRRDSCLVGVSCHIPSSGLSYACFHLSIMFKFLKPELRNLEASKP